MNYGPASKYYDLFGSKDDIPFYETLAVKQGKALELGVGTGRVAIPLARAGVTVIGIDNSRYMLDVARQKLRRLSSLVRKRVTLKLGDMRSFRLKETFPLVYMAAATFEHCISLEEKSCLGHIHNVLETGGILAFDISQPLSEGQESSWWIDRQKLGEEEEVVRTIFSNRNLSTSIVSVNLFFDVYQMGKLRARFFEYGQARISSKEEVAELLRRVGFRVKQVYGDYDMSRYGESSSKAIFVAAK